MFTGKFGAQAKFYAAVSRFASSWIASVAAAVLLVASFATGISGLAVASFAIAIVWGMAMTYLLGFVLANRTWALATLALTVAVIAWLVVIGAIEGWNGPRRALVALLAGLALGVVARELWNRRQRGLQQRIDSLPQWESDELGPAAAEYRENYHRPESKNSAEPRSLVAKIVAAVLRPLPGATLIESTNSTRPVIAVYGTRVAIVYGSSQSASTDADAANSHERTEADASERVEVVVEKQLPPGAQCEVFELDEGLDAPTAGRISFTAAEPHALAMFLAGGAPANGDALRGKASHVHHKNLVSLQHNGLYAGGL